MNSGAVGSFFGNNGNAEGVLGPFEEEVRGASDKSVWAPRKRQISKMLMVLERFLYMFWRSRKGR